MGVNDIGKSYDFYSKIVGFPSGKSLEDGIVFLSLNHRILAMFPCDKLAKDACMPDAGGGFSGITLAHNVKTKQEVDAIIKSLRQFGIKITTEPQAAGWGR